MSIALACPHHRVLCAVSLANLARISLPPTLLDVIIAADNDKAGSAAETGLKRAVDALPRSGSKRADCTKPIGKDFNDCLRGLSA